MHSIVTVCLCDISYVALRTSTSSCRFRERHLPRQAILEFLGKRRERRLPKDKKRSYCFKSTAPRLHYSSRKYEDSTSTNYQTGDLTRFTAFSLPGQFAPRSASANRTLANSLPGTFAPWPIRSLALSLPGTFAPGPFRSLAFSLLD